MAFINRLGHPESQPGSIILAGLVDHRVAITDTLQVRDNARKNAYLYIVTDVTYDFLSDDLVRNGWNIVAKKFSGTDAAPTVPELQALGVDLLVIDFYAWAVTGALLDLAYSAYQAGISVITTGNDTAWSPGNPIWTGAASAANASLTPISPVGTHPVSQGWSAFGDGDVATYSSGLRATVTVVGQFANGAPAIFVEQDPSGSGARYVHCQPLSTAPSTAFWDAALSWIELAHEGDTVLSSTRSLSENIGITDAVTPQLQRPVSDVENLSDTGVARNPHGRGVDWMNVSDSLVIVNFFDQQFQRTPSDNIGITDAVLAVRERFAADTIGVTDSLAFVLQFGPLDEVVSITDSLVFTSEEVISSTMGLTDALQTKLNPEVIDNTGLTDANQATDILGETADNLGLTDVVDPLLIVAASYEQSISDTLGLRDHTGARAYVWTLGSGENTILASYLETQGWTVVTKYSTIHTLPTVQELLDDSVDLFIADYATSGVPGAILDLAYSAYQAGISIATTGAGTTYSPGCPIWTTAWIGSEPDFSPVTKYTPPFQDIDPLDVEFITGEWEDFNDNITYIAQDFFRQSVIELAEYNSDWFGNLIAAWAEENPINNGARWVHMQSPASIVPSTFWLRAFIWLRQTTLGDIEFEHTRSFDDTLGLTDSVIPAPEISDVMNVTDEVVVEAARIVADATGLSEQSINRIVNPRPISTSGWMLTNPGSGGAVTTSYDSSIEAFSTVVAVASSDGHYTFQIGNSLSTWVPVQGGRVYYQRIEAMSSVTDVRDIAIDWFDASGNPVGSSTGGSFTLTQSLWVTLSMSATAPATAAYAAANIIVRNAAQSIIRPVGSRLAFRRAMLVEGQPVAYFDGDTDRGSTWSGIANASASIKTLDIAKTSIQEPSDALELSDVASVQPGLGLSEAPQLTDSWTIHIERLVSDNIGVTEVVGPAEDNEESPVEIVELSDALFIEFIPGIFYTDIRTDSAGLSDAVTLVFEYGVSVDDNTGVADTADTLAVYLRNLLESAGTHDTVSALREIERQINDDAISGDTVVFDTELPLSDGVDLDDAIELSLGPDVRDTVELTDSIQIVAGYARVPVDTAWLSDSVAGTAVYIRTLAETTILSDQVSLEISLSRQDAIGLTDANRIYDLDVATYPASNLGITDAVVVALERGIFISDSSSVTDTTTRAVSFIRTITDQTSVYSTPVSSRGFNVSITDDIGVIDLGDASSPSGHHTELINIDDDIDFSYFKEAFQTDVFNMGDELVVELTIQIHFFSYANLRDAVTVAESDETQHSDSAIITDVVEFSRGHGIDETAGLDDVVSIAAGLPFSESVALSDNVAIAMTLGVSSSVVVTDQIQRQLDMALSETLNVDDGAGNLALNPSLETDDSFWYATIGSTVGTRETSGGYDGSAFYRATWTAPTSDGGGILVFQQPVKAGFTYAMAVRVRTGVTKNVYLSAVWENASQAQIGLSSGATTPIQAGEWTYLLMENVQAPAGTVFVKPRVFVSGASVAGDTLDADLLVIQQTSWVNPFEVETSIGYGRAVADDSVIFDNINSIASLNPSDSAGLSETIAVVLAAAQQRTENVLVSDSLDRAVGRDRSVSDSMGLADNTTIQRTRSVAPTETVVIVDTLDIVVGIRRDDEITLEDNATASLGVSRSHADAVDLSDALTLDVVWGHANLIRVFDSISIQTGTNRTVNYYDPIPLSDVARVVTTYPRDPREDVGLVDSIIIDLSLGVRDPLAVTDTAVRNTSFTREFFDATQVSDVHSLDTTLGLSDSITIQDGTDDVTPYARELASDLGVTDSISIVAHYAVPLVESTGLTDSHERETAFTRFFYNLEFVRDAVARGYARSLSDEVGSSDSIVVAEGQGAAYADDLGLSDAISIDLTLSIADSVDTLDDADPTVAFLRLVTEAAPVSDALLVEEAEAESVSVFDPISLSDLISIEQTMSGAMLAEAVPAGSGHVIVPRAFQDVVDVIDARAFVAEYSRQFTNLVVLNDPRTVASTYVRGHADAIGVTDSVAVDLDDVTEYEDITVYSIKLRTDWDADARESGYDAMASSRYDGSVRVEQMYIRLALREEIEL